MRTSLFLFVFLSCHLIYGQTDYCKEFKTGVFQFLGYNKGVYTVIRTETDQFERNSKQAWHNKMKIKWQSDCYYVLYDMVEYRWGKQPVKDDEFPEAGNIVYKFEKPNKFYVKTFLPGIPDTVITVFTKLDTTNYYNNLFQLEAFAEYKNSKAYGQTMLGEIHSIDYYQSTKVPNQYLITFETTYHGEKLNKTRLLDSVVVKIKDDENITNSNCRFNDQFDDEIIAVYRSKDETKEANIIKAFRCNRDSEKIEEVDVKKVKYKEEDRNKIRWK
jgi:hypothetical protein